MCINWFPWRLNTGRSTNIVEWGTVHVLLPSLHVKESISSSGQDKNYIISSCILYLDRLCMFLELIQRTAKAKRITVSFFRFCESLPKTIVLHKEIRNYSLYMDVVSFIYTFTDSEYILTIGQYLKVNFNSRLIEHYPWSSVNFKGVKCQCPIVENSWMKLKFCSWKILIETWVKQKWYLKVLLIDHVAKV